MATALLLMARVVWLELELALVLEHACSCISIGAANSAQHLSTSDAQKIVSAISSKLPGYNLQLQCIPTQLCKVLNTLASCKWYAFRFVGTAWFHSGIST